MVTSVAVAINAMLTAAVTAATAAAAVMAMDLSRLLSGGFFMLFLLDVEQFRFLILPCL